MKLLPNEEKLSALEAPKLFLTNQRIIEDLDTYGSINLKDITLIKTVYFSNNRPVVLGAVILAVSFAFDQPFIYAGAAAFVLGLLYSISLRRSTLDIFTPGSGNISVKVNYVDKKTIRDFIYKIETEMERVKNAPNTLKTEPFTA